MDYRNMIVDLLNKVQSQSRCGEFIGCWIFVVREDSWATLNNCCNRSKNRN